MKVFTGKVISKSMQKTATVAVGRIVAHPIYKKRIKKIKKYQVHDELETKIGQTVRFVASKPYSKTKKWIVIDVVNSAKGKEQKTNKKKGNTEKTEKPKNTERKRKTATHNKKRG